MKKTEKRDFLWIVLMLVIFLNGFEAGGYQASLWSIGQDFDLSLTSMGLYAAMELFATMLAPILLGGWADRTNKTFSIALLLGIQLTAAGIVLLTASQTLFLGGVFFLGMTTSALQFIAIATLADAYPVTGSRKIATVTGMYATGALVSPLAVDFYLRHGLAWRTLFGLLLAGSLLGLVGILRAGSEPREERPQGTGEEKSGDGLVLVGVLLLCVVMCIYVGFENGFTFFVDTLFTDTFQSSLGKLALSLFWAVMIPARLLVGRFADQAKKILVGSILAIPAATVLLTLAPAPVAALLLCIPLGLASGAIYPCVLTLLLPFAGKRTATATGMITAATGIGGVLFTALTGFLADALGLRMAMLVLVCFFALSLAAALGAIRKSNAATRKRETRPQGLDK